MDRYEKYGSGQEILERIQRGSRRTSFRMNADMIFNFPAQTEDTLIHDIEMRGGFRCEPDNVLSADGLAVGAAVAGRARWARWTTTRERRFYEIICDLLLGDLPGGQPGLFELRKRLDVQPSRHRCCRRGRHD